DLSLLRFDLQAGTLRLHDVMRKYLAESFPDQAVLHGRLIDAWGDPRRLPDPFAWRWYAHHLRDAGRRERLEGLLFDIDWLEAKLVAPDPNALLTDYDLLPDAPPARLVQGAIRLSAHVLSRDPSQLRGQLLGRLLDQDQPTIRSLCTSSS